MTKKTDLLVKGLTQEQKDFLYEYAQKNFGSRSRTKAIIELINKEMDKEPKDNVTIPEPEIHSKNKKRVQFSIRESDYNNLKKIAIDNDSSIQHYIISLILKDLYAKQLMLGSELELLRKSNYELHKIGVNVNKIAKAINVGEDRVLPINQLREYIEQHVALVQNLLLESSKKY